jgi:hypothetical protein
MDLAFAQLLADVETALAAGDMLAPGFSGQCIRIFSGPVPAVALGYILDAGRDVFRQGNSLALFVNDAVADGGIDVAVGIVAEQPPHGAIGLEGYGALLPGGVEQIWQDCILGNVLGDVFLGVVRTHLFLVDVLLEDVADHIGVDLVVGAEGPLIKMPAIVIKEVEELFECLVRNVDVGILFLKLVNLEEAAIQIRHLTQQFLHRRIEFAFFLMLA